MSNVRIAVASTPLTATLDEAVPAAVAAVAEAGRLGARIVCLPETGAARTPRPGSRRAGRVPATLDDALDGRRGRARGRRRGDRRDGAADACRPRDRLRSCSTRRDTARRAGEDPDRPVRGGRTTSRAAAGACSRRPALTFGIAICHEAFRYPEIGRALALGGAQVVFVPHFVTTEDGSLPTRWCAASNPYNEKALMLPRAREHGLRRRVERRRPDQGSVTCIIAPDGTLVARLDVRARWASSRPTSISRADGLLARRWAPERTTPLI